VNTLEFPHLGAVVLYFCFLFNSPLGRREKAPKPFNFSRPPRARGRLRALHATMYRKRA
jgi:hypothetical protein